MNKTIIKNGIIIQPDKILNNHNIIISDNRIISITDENPNKLNYQVIDAKGGYITPGFVDMHIHGCGGYSLEMGGHPVRKMYGFLKSKGINSFVPTILSDPALLKKVAEEINESNDLRKNIHGIYVEGPFLTINRRGAILKKYIKQPNLDYMKFLYDQSQGLLKFMTIAPEMEGIEKIIEFLLDNGVVVSFGHSNCLLNDVFKYKMIKPRNITHLFNAMSSINHKSPGLATLPFIDKNCFYELISDNIHVDPSLISMCYKNTNPDRCVLISDAVVAAGLKYGSYNYLGNKIDSSSKGVFYSEREELVGSNTLLTECFKKYIKNTGASLDEAVRAVTLNPLSLMGLSDKKGSIELGKEADIVIWDKDFNVQTNLSLT